MILKLYNYTNSNWVFKDNIQELTVSDYGKFYFKKYTEEAPLIKSILDGELGNIPIIKGYPNEDKKGNSEKPVNYILYNKTKDCIHNVEWWTFMFEPVKLFKHYKYSDEIFIRVIKIKRNEEEEHFIISDSIWEEYCEGLKEGTSPVGYLLNDSGKTIERL